MQSGKHYFSVLKIIKIHMLKKENEIIKMCMQGIVGGWMHKRMLRLSSVNTS